MENISRKQWKDIKEEKRFAAALISVRDTRGRTFIIAQAFGWAMRLETVVHSLFGL
ncbi:MAG TPA: hypothetical protein VOA41_00560 [Candidatus Dormibacteraeota bacterium]|nr:hypothetical protein [Candidatus Dormibacteraeota bacterium]